MRKYAKVGDKVRVINPMRFVRVGYPLCPQVVRDTRKEDIDKMVFAMAKSIGAIKSLSKEVALFHDQPVTLKVVDEYRPFWMDEINARLRRDLERAAITHILRSEHFGGNERQIFEKEEKYLLNKVGKVTDKKIVKTGSRRAPWGGYDYWGEYDCDSGGLDDAKTHVVYQLEFNQFVEDDEIYIRCIGDDYWVVATNCEIVPAE